jgi:hypothetical protein
MTDDKIKEEFEKWLYSDDMSKEEASFPDYFDNIECDDTEFLAHGFYAGFRAAERLAKIEVLEELNKQICLQDTKVPEYMDFDTYMKGACDNVNESLRIINNMLSDLKG